MTTTDLVPVPVDYDGEWPAQFARLAREVRDACVPYDAIEKIEHVGGTSIAGLFARPIIDVLIEVKPGAKYFEQVSRTLISSGFTIKPEKSIQGRAEFTRLARNAEAGIARSSQAPRTSSPTIQIYVLTTGDQGALTHLAFRDFLRANSEVSTSYGALKKKFFGSDAVTLSAYEKTKNSFVLANMKSALDWYSSHDLKDGRKRKPKKKVVVYVTRVATNGRTELLVFDHVNPSYANASPQVPSGSVYKKEEIPLAAERELFEEAGLELELAPIGSYVYYKEHLDRFQDRHHFLGRASARPSDRKPIPDSWTHHVTGEGNDRNLVFKFYWVSLSQAREILQADLGRGLDYFGVT